MLSRKTAMSELNAPPTLQPPDDISPERLARLSVEKFIGEGLTVSAPQNPIAVLTRRAGAFVTLRSSGGQLRGCMGTTEPSHPTVAEHSVQGFIALYLLIEHPCLLNL